jgi:hypothetical protein
VWIEDGKETFAWADKKPELMYDHCINAVNDDPERVVAWRRI